MTEELKPIDVSKYHVTENGNVLKQSDNHTELEKEAGEYAICYPKVEKGEILTSLDLQEAYIAGVKAHFIQWHDLRKDPSDLPKENGEYACRIPYYDSEITFNGFLNYNSEQKVFWLDDIKSNFTVVAWCEIPTFTDKE